MASLPAAGRLAASVPLRTGTGVPRTSARTTVYFAGGRALDVPSAPSMSQPPELTAELYAHLRAIARRVCAGHDEVTVEPTALVHEAWLKLAGHPGFESRLHFLRSAALAMRQVLVDQARARASAKRGNRPARTTLSGIPGDTGTFDLVDLDASLSKLHALDPGAADVVLLRCFGGLTLEETAEVLELSERTISTRWRHARAWLIANLG